MLCNKITIIDNLTIKCIPTVKFGQLNFKKYSAKCKILQKEKEKCNSHCNFGILGR